MSLKVFLLYLATWSLVALTPGPAVMCALSQAARHGFRASLVGITGTQAGNFLFFAATALGLAALLETATLTLDVLRVAGAAYLLYLGLRIILSTLCRKEAPADAEVVPSARRSLFLQGLMIQLTNPKALLFVSALLPQFLAPDRPLWPQLAILLAVTVAVDYLVLSAYALLAACGARSFRNSRLIAWLERTLGATLIFFGCRLLFARR